MICLLYEDDRTQLEAEFFLPGGIGWRLKANQLLQTTDGGKTWATLKAEESLTGVIQK
jgi:photosystem II stability/assembly factor-like uncharacterized protein